MVCWVSVSNINGNSIFVEMSSLSLECYIYNSSSSWWDLALCRSDCVLSHFNKSSFRGCILSFYVFTFGSRFCWFWFLTFSCCLRIFLLFLFSFYSIFHFFLPFFSYLLFGFLIFVITNCKLEIKLTFIPNFKSTSDLLTILHWSKVNVFKRSY